MCEPITTTQMFVAQMGMAVMQQYQAGAAQNAEADRTLQVAADTKEAGKAALALQYQQLSLQGAQQDDAATESLLSNAVQAAQLESTLAVSAGESGVGGISVNNLLADYKRQYAQNATIADVNSKARAQQRLMEKQGLKANYLNRVRNARNGIVSGADPYAAALNLGGETLTAGTKYLGWGMKSGKPDTNSTTPKTSATTYPLPE